MSPQPYFGSSLPPSSESSVLQHKRKLVGTLQHTGQGVGCLALEAGRGALSMAAVLLLLWGVPLSLAASCKRDGPPNGPCVDLISPNSGSLAGGQLLSIYGTNLLPESPDPLTPAAVVTVGGIQCDLLRVMSSSVKLVCKTRPHAALRQLNGVASSNPIWYDRGCDIGAQPVVVSVLGLGGDITGRWNAGSRYCLKGNVERRCMFSYAWLATPSITAISPRSASPGDLITVFGKTCAGDLMNALGERTEPALKRFERVLIGDTFCELSTPACDTSSTRQCPSMYLANVTSPWWRPMYRPGNWQCEEGWFQCRLPAGLSLGRHNVSFKLPSEKGDSVLEAAAVSVGVLADEEAAAFEAITTITGVDVHPSDPDLLVLSASGLLTAAANATTIRLSGDEKPPPGVECPLVAGWAPSTGTLVCNRSLAETQWLESSSWPASCRAILVADPAAQSGFYRVRSLQTPRHLPT